MNEGTCPYCQQVGGHATTCERPIRREHDRFNIAFHSRYAAADLTNGEEVKRALLVEAIAGV